MKPAGLTSGTMYGLCRVHKQQVDGCLQSRSTLLAYQTLTYNLVKLLAPILDPFTKNKHTVKDLFQSAKQICVQGQVV